MNLGVERYKLGDILIDGNQAYLICMADMADYICAELKKCAIRACTVKSRRDCRRS